MRKRALYDVGHLSVNYISIGNIFLKDLTTSFSDFPSLGIVYSRRNRSFGFLEIDIYPKIERCILVGVTRLYREG